MQMFSLFRRLFCPLMLSSDVFILLPKCYSLVTFALGNLRRMVFKPNYKGTPSIIPYILPRTMLILPLIPFSVFFTICFPMGRDIRMGFLAAFVTYSGIMLSYALLRLKFRRALSEKNIHAIKYVTRNEKE